MKGWIWNGQEGVGVLMASPEGIHGILTNVCFPFPVSRQRNKGDRKFFVPVLKGGSIWLDQENVTEETLCDSETWA